MGAFDTKTFEFEIKDNAVSVTSENAELIKRCDYVESTTISVNLLNLILENKDMFNYALLVFSGNSKSFQIVENLGSPMELRSFISKRKIYRAFVEAIRFGRISLTDETRARFHMLKEMTFITYYEQSHKDDEYKISIEGKYYSFKVSNFFSLLRMDSLQLASLLENNDEINGVKKEYYLYALRSYFSSNYILTNYDMSPNMTKNYTVISDDLYVDTRAINIHYEDELLIDEVVIDSDLENYILSGIKDEFSLLEKCIYVYIKMCKIFTYDEAYFAANQKGEVAKKHKNIRHLSEITLKNNSLVCYEFSKIYAYILKLLGVSSKSYDGMHYGEGHDKVEFRVDKFLIIADAVSSIFSGDLFNVKLNKKPSGIICLNKNSKSNKEFDDAINKMMDYVECEERFEYQEVLQSYSLENIVGCYRELTTNYKDVPFSERVSILLDKISSIKSLKGMDMYSYIKSISSCCFSSSEKNHNVSFKLVKDNRLKSEFRDPGLIGVLTINKDGFSNLAYENDYYVYSPELGIKQVSYYTLKECFENGEFEYIDSSQDKKIPGLEVIGGISL